MAGKVERTFRYFSPRVAGMPRAVPMLMAALSSQAAGVRQVVIVGPAGRPDTTALRTALDSRFLPFALCVPVDPQGQAALAELLPFVRTLAMRDGRATAYVCRDFVCRMPTTDPDEMLAQVG